MLDSKESISIIISIYKKKINRKLKTDLKQTQTPPSLAGLLQILPIGQLILFHFRTSLLLFHKEKNCKKLQSEMVNISWFSILKSINLKYSLNFLAF